MTEEAGLKSLALEPDKHCQREADSYQHAEESLVGLGQGHREAEQGTRMVPKGVD